MVAGDSDWPKTKEKTDFQAGRLNCVTTCLSRNGFEPTWPSTRPGCSKTSNPCCRRVSCKLVVEHFQDAILLKDNLLTCPRIGQWVAEDLEPVVDLS